MGLMLPIRWGGLFIIVGLRAGPYLIVHVNNTPNLGQQLLPRRQASSTWSTLLQPEDEILKKKKNHFGTEIEIGLNLLKLDLMFLSIFIGKSYNIGLNFKLFLELFMCIPSIVFHANFSLSHLWKRWIL